MLLIRGKEIQVQDSRNRENKSNINRYDAG